MIGSISTFATPALAGFAARGLTAMRMSDAELKPWDVKQEGGQMDSGWGTGECCCLACLAEQRVGTSLAVDHKYLNTLYLSIG